MRYEFHIKSFYTWKNKKSRRYNLFLFIFQISYETDIYREGNPFSRGKFPNYAAIREYNIPKSIIKLDI